MKKFTIFVCTMLCGCQTLTVSPEFEYKEIQTSTFKLASWQKITQPKLPYKIYIEGDGAAFRADGSVSYNPTPRGIMLREIAFGDMHPNVIYLARPCQYVKDGMCKSEYWSTARFSAEVTQAEYEAVKSLSGAQPITLVGFSGGAQIAGLIAVKYNNLKIQKLVTVADNLDVKSWTDYHQITPLSLSDDLAKYRIEYAKFNQIHYVGEKDTNIVPSITENFVADKNNIKYIKKASHNSGWEASYDLIRGE